MMWLNKSITATTWVDMEVLHKKISNPFLHLSWCTSAFAIRHHSIKDDFDLDLYKN